MGAKTWMLAYVDGNAREALASNPELDKTATHELARSIFPSDHLEQIDDGDLSHTCPPDDEVLIGCFEGLTIIAAKEFGIDNPSKLDSHFLAAATGPTVYLHAMHSVVDWFAYAKWENGKLVRSLSLAPDSGIAEDIGERLSFEEPFWCGKHPVFEPGEEDNDYPFPFHPLELGEAALLAMFGYQLEGYIDPEQVEPENIPLLAFKRVKQKKTVAETDNTAEVKKPWWKFW